MSNKTHSRNVLRVIGGIGLFLLLASSTINLKAQTADASRPNSNEHIQGGGFYRFKVGDFECTVISDGMITPPIDIFRGLPKSEIENILHDNFLPTKELTLNLQTLIVKTGTKLILIDTGAGKGRFPLAGNHAENLLRAGIKPEDITDVLITHAHFDHIGGILDSTGKVRFPNARFYISETESESVKNMKQFRGEAALDEATLRLQQQIMDSTIAAIKDKISIFKSDATIVPGIQAINAPGNTPGHSMYLVKSGNDSLLFVGDLIHHAAIQFTRPEYSIAFDSLAKEAISNRKQTLDRVLNEKTRIMGAHLPFPGIGNIKKGNATQASYEWVPVEWRW